MQPMVLRMRRYAQALWRDRATKHTLRSPNPRAIPFCQPGAIASPVRQVDVNQRFIKPLSAIAPGACPLRLHFGRALSSGPLTHPSGDCPIKLKQPINAYFGFLMDSMLGSDYEIGLQNLKNLAEG